MVTLPRIARGDALALPSPVLLLPSPLPGVPASAWSLFLRALSVQRREEETPRGLGVFAMRPKRLGDLGCVTNLRRESSPGKRQVWVGDFVHPLTREKFLASPLAQYNLLVRSVTRHATEIDGVILPDGVTRSGALAILHGGGPGALRNWSKGPHFENTQDLFHRANGIF